MRRTVSSTRSRPTALPAGAQQSALSRVRSGCRMVVRGGVGVVEAVPRGLNYVASVDTLVVERREAAVQAVNFGSDDARQARLAFLEKRDAQFSGR